MPGRSLGHRNGPRTTTVGLVVLALLALLGALAGCRIPGDRPPATPWPHGPVSNWQWQLSGELDPEAAARIFVLDPFTTPAEDVRRLVARDRRLVCYVEVGTYYPDRPDAARFPAQILGATTGLPRTGGSRDGGRWLDIRQWAVIEPILADRFRLCRGKGFEAVMPADMDGYAQRSGFPLTFDDQLVFNRRLAGLIRSLHLSPGLTNDVDQVMALQPEFDFAVNEGCFRNRECARLLPFVEAGKPVLHVEYDQPPAAFCVETIGYGFVSMRKNRTLDAWRDPCPD
ncbi:endo alpha-1,4 polygalactosaminidase [Micromonospora sp. NPDC003197]